MSDTLSTDLVMMEMDQAAVNIWLSPSTTEAARASGDAASRFHGAGVRYKAKLVGVETVTKAHGDKMCRDSMMKLKGIEAARRRQGKHKQTVWLKISASSIKIEDERTRAVLHDHMTNRISSIIKDKSDPRALAYVYQQQDSYNLFYIKMANLADPVLADIKEVCQRMEETPQEATQQNRALLILNEGSVLPPETSSSNELTEVFTLQREEPCTCHSESPQQTLSSSQILSMFPVQPVAAPPCSSTTTMPWGQQGILGNQWTAPMAQHACACIYGGEGSGRCHSQSSSQC